MAMALNGCDPLGGAITVLIAAFCMRSDSSRYCWQMLFEFHQVGTEVHQVCMGTKSLHMDWIRLRQVTGRIPCSPTVVLFCEMGFVIGLLNIIGSVKTVVIDDGLVKIARITLGILRMPFSELVLALSAMDVAYDLVRNLCESNPREQNCTIAIPVQL